jgi:HAD superfamily hydrolase (TIGR01458 family)
METKAVLLDIDGVLCIRDRVIEGAPEALSKLRETYKIALVTNTTRVPSRMIFERMRSLGFDIERGELFTALRTAKEFLLKDKANAYLLVSEWAKEEFESLEAYTTKYVAVADAYTNFTYQNLNTAFRLLLEGADLIAIAPNKYFMDEDGKLSLDAGPFVKALEYASGKTAKVMGKPSPEFFKIVFECLKVNPEEVLMVGDDIEFDILGAQKLGMKTCLVKTGKFRESDLEKGIKPDIVLETVRELPKALM